MPDSLITPCFICGKSFHYKLLVVKEYKSKDRVKKVLVCQKCAGVGQYAKKAPGKKPKRRNRRRGQ